MAKVEKRKTNDESTLRCPHAAEAFAEAQASACEERKTKSE
jgi:hypothetical protein